MYRTCKGVIKQTAENICRGCFLAAVCLITLTCLISVSSYRMDDQYVQKTLLEMLFDRFWQEIALQDVEFSVEMMLTTYASSDWFVILLLLGCAFPSVSAFLAEYRR